MASLKHVTFLSYNVRGINSDTKRLALYKWLESKNCDMYFLQETHCHLRKDEQKWSKEWKGQSVWSKGTARSKGVTILFNPRFKYEYTDVVIDTNGRYIKLILTMHEYKYRCINVYAPNNEFECVKFISTIPNLITEDENEGYIETILGGDLNCVLDNSLDRKNCNSSQDVGQIDLKALMNAFELEDVWRRRNPDHLSYTWEGRGKKSRIDFWLISKSLDSQAENIAHDPAPFSDHSAIQNKICIDETERGNGIWKMNTSILTNPVFKTNFELMWKELKEQQQLYYDIKTWWDIAKRRIKDLALNISRKAKSDQAGREREIENRLVLHSNSDETTNLKNELNDIFEKRGVGAKIRSRARWWEEGERSSKYFHSLEKKNGKDKSWNKILDKNGKMLHDTNDVQLRQVEFYKSLYSTKFCNNKEKEDDFLKHVDKTLNDVQNTYMNADLSIEEIGIAIKAMKNNKSPGPDGIPAEFYKIYWSYIKHDLLKIYTKGLEDKELAYSQYLALITLLYKKGRREDIKNWRPISLLNVD